MQTIDRWSEYKELNDENVERCGYRSIRRQKDWNIEIVQQDISMRYITCLKNKGQWYITKDGLLRYHGLVNDISMLKSMIQYLTNYDNEVSTKDIVTEDWIELVPNRKYVMNNWTMVYSYHMWTINYGIMRKFRGNIPDKEALIKIMKGLKITI